MHAVKTVFWKFAILSLAIGYSAKIATAADEASAGPTLEERAASILKINGRRDVDWYSPLEIAKGGHAKPFAVVPEAKRSITSDVLQKAADYADAKGSVALLIWQGGKLQFAHYGPGSGPATRTDPASMHKSVMTILYGAALRDGFIKSIDEPASNYLPEWANDDRKKITIHNLMNMASGLEYVSPATPPASLIRQMSLGTDIAAAALAFQSVEAPGVTFDYNNADSENLGIILQRATGMRYADYLSKTLLQPLGTGDGRVWLDRPGGMAHTYCCLQLTGPDWLRIGLLLKDGGKVDGRQIIPAEWVQRMITPSSVNPNYGLQVWIANPYAPLRAYSNHIAMKIPASEPFLSKDMFFFDGAGAQRVYVSRAADLVIIRTGNDAPDWDDSYVPNLIMRGLKAKPAQ